MKKSFLISLILIFTFCGVLFSQEKNTVDPKNIQQNRESDESETNVKNTFIGINSLLGISNLTLGDFGSNYENKMQFSWGVSVSANIYFLRFIGLNFEFGYSSLKSKWKYSDFWTLTLTEIVLTYNIFHFNVGLGFKFGGFFLNGGMTTGIKLKAMYERTSNVFLYYANSTVSDAKTFQAGLYINLGYRLELGAVYLPIGVEFKYFLTDFADSATRCKFYMVYGKIGMEF